MLLLAFYDGKKYYKPIIFSIFSREPGEGSVWQQMELKIIKANRISQQEHHFYIFQ